ncbi:MAG: hypothetical protein P4L84_03105, partial [Isosphaeraceae bacterium]|nr:hypothetical protein [Isosphaeraceae bacterium]
MTDRAACSAIRSSAGGGGPPRGGGGTADDPPGPAADPPPALDLMAEQAARSVIVLYRAQWPEGHVLNDELR